MRRTVALKLIVIRYFGGVVSFFFQNSDTANKIPLMIVPHTGTSSGIEK
jgi:hypothetical protein